MSVLRLSIAQEKRHARRRLRIESLERRDPLTVDAAITLEDLLRSGAAPNPVNYANGLTLLAPAALVDRIRVPASDNLAAADTINADRVLPGGDLGLALTGGGLTVGVWDEGIARLGHQEFGGRVSAGESAAPADHSTHVTGTIAASGVNPAAKGMAPGVNVVGFDLVNDLAELDAFGGGLVASNHSYSLLAGWEVASFGSGFEDFWVGNRSLYDTEPAEFGSYGAYDAQVDTVLHDHPHLLSVFSAGNDLADRYQNLRGNSSYVSFFDPGPQGFPAGLYRVPSSLFPPPPPDGNGGTGFDSMTNPSLAKNSVTVGAVNDFTADPVVPAAVTIASFSSRGPVDDGRIKPDVVANGTTLLSPIAASNTSYASFSGTSMAAASVTGASTLLIEHFQDSLGGLPRSATTKGILIHTAADLGNLGPDYTHGWGLVDVAAGAQFITSASGTPSASGWLAETAYAGIPTSWRLEADGSSPIKVSMVWTDLPGSPSSGLLDDPTPALVHDLDLWIEGPGGQVFRPWTLDPTNPSAPATRSSANHVDNVEQVVIDVPVAGVYTVRVGHSGASFAQDFSLLVSGLIPDATAPQATIAKVNPDPRTSPVSSISISFSEAVVGFDISDLELRRDGGPNLLTNAQRLNFSNPTEWVLSNLRGVTATNGVYQLTIKAGSLSDEAGNPLAESVNEWWVKQKADVLWMEPYAPPGAPTTGMLTAFSNGNVFFSPNGEDLAGGGDTVRVYSGSQQVVWMEPYQGAIVTAFSDGSVYRSPNGENLHGGGSTTLEGFKAGKKVVWMEPYQGGITVAWNDGTIYASPNGRDFDGNDPGTATRPLYAGPGTISWIEPYKGGLFYVFDGRQVYYSPDGNNPRGGGRTELRYQSSNGRSNPPVVRMEAFRDGVFTVFADRDIKFSPDGRNLNGGGRTSLAWYGEYATDWLEVVDEGVMTAFSNGDTFLSVNGTALGAIGSRGVRRVLTGTRKHQWFEPIDNGLLDGFFTAYDGNILFWELPT